MAKSSPLTLRSALIDGAVLLLIAHAVSTQFWGYPFLYCWLQPVTSTLYMNWGIIVLYAVSAYILIQLFRRGVAQALGGVLLFIAIIELPRLADAVFRRGGSCG